jgi:hypothetical protein
VWYHTVSQARRWKRCRCQNRNLGRWQRVLRSTIAGISGDRSTEGCNQLECRGSVRRGQTFWGSSGSSAGCGHRTFVPSFVNFSLAANASPNSIFASLPRSNVNYGINLGGASLLGVNNQTASTLLVKREKINRGVRAQTCNRAGCLFRGQLAFFKSGGIFGVRLGHLAGGDEMHQGCKAVTLGR